MSRPTMADELGLSKQSILNLIDSLTEKGFLKKDEKTSYLKTTKTWDVVYFSDLAGKESLPPTSKETLPHAGKESLPNNNTLDNNSLFDNKEYSEFNFIKDFNEIRKSNYKLISSVKTNLKNILKSGYTYKEILEALKNAMQDSFHIEKEFNDLTPEFITRSDKFEKYLNYKPIIKKSNSKTGVSSNLTF